MCIGECVHQSFAPGPMHCIWCSSTSLLQVAASATSANSLQPAAALWGAAFKRQSRCERPGLRQTVPARQPHAVRQLGQPKVESAAAVASGGAGAAAARCINII